MKKLKLDLLHDGSSTGLSVRYGGFLAEAASVCLHLNKHNISVTFKVEGSIEETYELYRLDVDDIALKSFADIEEAVQFGAMGIAIILINVNTGWKAIRSWKGTGFDYWFGDDDIFPFQNKLRVEISGDFKGNDSELNQRLIQKIQQTNKSENVQIPACGVIVEFSIPKSLIALS
jgi:hypothetical protein